jgi:carboxymethylenebutenolidase
MAEEIKELIQEYQQGQITRRAFMRRAAAITGSLAAAHTLINELMQSSGHAAQVDPRDSNIVWHNVAYDGKAGPVSGYLVRPAAAGKYPGIIVIHANQGIGDHFRDVARRLAKEGYIALVPDYLSRQGGTAKVNPQGRGLENIRALMPWQLVAEDTDAGYAYLRTLSDVRGDRMGLVGFCWGGEMTFSSATQVRRLRAAVVFYGRSPGPLELVKNIQAPILAHYGENDPGVNKGIPDTVEAMKKYEKSYTYKIYPGAGHGFHSDGGSRYHPEAAREAWARTLEFFKKNLKS